MNRSKQSRMARKPIIILLVGLTLASIRLAEAQPQAKVSKIGWLSARPASEISGQEVIVRMLRDLGYVEGKNIAYEYRYANNKLDRFPALADELVRLKVDVLLTPGDPWRPCSQERYQNDPHRFYRCD
jgi:hypothetical protein